MYVRGEFTDVVFHDAATEVAVGKAFTVGSYRTLTVEIYGTSTSRTVAFLGKGPSGTARALRGENLETQAGASSTTGTGELWRFNITGLVEVLIDLQAVAGGNVSVKGRAVA